MGFWNTIGEAAATFNGDDAAAARFNAKRTAGQPDPHAELQGKTDQILGDVKAIQGKITALGDKPDPAKLAEYNGQLAKAQQAFTDLYHPTKNPGAMQHLGRFLQKHVLKKEPAPLPKSNAVTPGRMTELGGYAAGAAPVTPDPYLTPDELKKKARIAAGLDPKAATERPESENWVPTLVKLADGREVTLQRNSKDGRWTDLAGKAVPPEILSSASMIPKGGAGGNSKFSQEKPVYEKQWGKKIEDWSPEELSYFNQKMAYDAQRSGQSTTTRLEKDENGVIHPVEITNTRGPTKPPVDPHAAPMTPGQAKTKAAAMAPKGNVKVGEPLPFKGSTPAVASAQKDVKDAVALSSTADQVAQNPNDAINQKRLAVALERVSAGRFTTQALDYIIKSGWGNTLEQWANNPSTGALPADVVRQLVDGAHQNLKAKQDALAAAEGMGGGGGGAPQGSGKAVSLAEAKKLPAMKGKTDAEITAAIKAAGHEVKP